MRLRLRGRRVAKRKQNLVPGGPTRTDRDIRFTIKVAA
jgi:hypothetical protein